MTQHIHHWQATEGDLTDEYKTERDKLLEELRNDIKPKEKNGGYFTMQLVIIFDVVCNNRKGYIWAPTGFFIRDFSNGCQWGIISWGKRHLLVYFVISYSVVIQNRFLVAGRHWLLDWGRVQKRIVYCSMKLRCLQYIGSISMVSCRMQCVSL